MRPSIGAKETNYLGRPELLVSAATRQRLKIAAASLPP